MFCIQYALAVCPEHLSARSTYGSFRFTFSAIIVIIVKHRVLIVFLPFCASPPPSLLFAKCHLRAHRVPHRRSQSATSSIANLHHHFFFNKLPYFWYPNIHLFIYSNTTGRFSVSHEQSQVYYLSYAMARKSSNAVQGFVIVQNLYYRIIIYYYIL